jgi:hypothetical protein
MHKAFEQYFNSLGAEFSTEWKSILREIKTTTTYDVFGNKWDTQLNLLTSIIEDFGFLPFTNHSIDFDIQEDCFRIIIEAKEFTIFIEPDCIEFYNEDLEMTITCIEDLRNFYQITKLFE